MSSPPRPSAFDLRLRDVPKVLALRRDADRRAALFRKPQLTYLFWEATLRCNLRCAHCGSSCGPTATRHELTTEEICRILDTIGEDFDVTKIFASITGGEPLLRPDIDCVVEHMTRMGMDSSMVTNGLLLGEGEATRLVDCGMRSLSISVDGMRHEHEQMRGKSTWAKALGAITRARQAGFALVEAITCVRPGNLSGLREVEDAVRDAGAHRWRLITIDRMGRGGEQGEHPLWLDPPEVRQLLEFIEGRRKYWRASDSFDLQFSCGGFLGPRHELGVRPGDSQCFAGLCVGSILHDGQVSACPSMPRSWAQGSALQHRFSTLWRTKFGPFRDMSWRRAGICGDCSWFNVCIGGGLHERLAQPEEFCWLDRQDGRPPTRA